MTRCIHLDVSIEWLTQEKYRATCLNCGLVYEGPTGLWKKQKKFSSDAAKLVYDRPPRWANNAVKEIELRDREFAKAVGEFQRRMLKHVANRKKSVPLFGPLNDSVVDDPQAAATMILDAFFTAERKGWDIAKLIAQRVKVKKHEFIPAEPSPRSSDGEPSGVCGTEPSERVELESLYAAGAILSDGEQQ